jgi:hypothetical protein
MQVGTDVVIVTTIVEANQIIHRPSGIEKGTIAAHRNFASKLQHQCNVNRIDFVNLILTCHRSSTRALTNLFVIARVLFF